MLLDTVPRNRRGQALLEYAIIVALVGTCLVAILGLVGTSARHAFTNTSTVVRQTAGAPAPVGGGSGTPQAIPAGSPGAPDRSRNPDGEPPDSSIVDHTLQ